MARSNVPSGPNEELWLRLLLFIYHVFGTKECSIIDMGKGKGEGDT